MPLLRPDNDIARQGKHLYRDEINPAQDGRRAVVIVGVIPAGDRAGAHAEDLVHRIGEEGAVCVNGMATLKRKEREMFSL